MMSDFWMGLLYLSFKQDDEITQYVAIMIIVHILKIVGLGANLHK